MKFFRICFETFLDDEKHYKLVEAITLVEAIKEAQKAYPPNEYAVVSYHTW